MSDRPALLFHLGFPKCASTTLQRVLFEPHPQVHDIGKPRHLEHPETAAFIRTLSFSEFFSFRRNLDAQAFFADQIMPGKLNVFSCEDLAMGPYWFTDQPKTADRHSLLLSLRLLGPEAKVLVVLRDQMHILPSIYTQLRAWGGTKLPDFQTWIDIQTGAPVGPSILDALDYAVYLDAVAEVFGRDRMIVLDFAQVAADTQGTLAALAMELGLDPLPPVDQARHNARRTGLEVRLLNVWKKAPMLRKAVDRMPASLKHSLVGIVASLGRDVPTRFSDAQEQALKDHFRPRNDTLRSDWGLGEGWSA
jgi:hypothetical protein